MGGARWSDADDLFLYQYVDREHDIVDKACRRLGRSGAACRRRLAYLRRHPPVLNGPDGPGRGLVWGDLLAIEPAFCRALRGFADSR
jgi:hypothetical protein